MTKQHSAERKSDKPLAVGLGEILWDLFPDGRRLGGAPANFAYHIHHLGFRGVPVSRVGRDAPGDAIVERLNTLGVDGTAVQRDDKRPTGTVTVELTEDGEPTFTIHEDVAWDRLVWTDELEALAKACDVVCFGTLCQRSSLSRQTIRRFLRATPENCIRLLDVNLRQPYTSAAIVEASLHLANVLKLNEEEFPVVCRMTGVSGPEDARLSTLLAEYDLCAAALTRGSRGSVLRTREVRADCAGDAASGGDAVGAGDAFAAALAAGLYEGAAPGTINRAANRLGAFVAGQNGGTPPIPEPLAEQLWA